MRKKVQNNKNPYTIDNFDKEYIPEKAREMVLKICGEKKTENFGIELARSLMAGIKKALIK